MDKLKVCLYTSSALDSASERIPRMVSNAIRAAVACAKTSSRIAFSFVVAFSHFGL